MLDSRQALMAIALVHSLQAQSLIDSMLAVELVVLID
jgi:hypothetical protein